MNGRGTDFATLVVGAGVGGLAAGVEGLQFGSVAVCESSERVGGVLRSRRSNDGWLSESAAASFALPAPGTSTTLATVGAPDTLVAATSAAARRWLHVHGRLEELPSSPPALLRSQLVSPWAKLGALFEPFAAKPPMSEESVAAFLARRIGGEIARTVAQPVVSGIFGGDADRLSVDAAFPVLRELEAHGGLLRGGVARMRASRAAGIPRSRLHSFTDGMETLPRLLATWLDEAGAEVVTASPVRTLEPLGKSGAPRWRVVTEDATYTSNRVLLACPPATTAALVEPLSRAAAEAARAVRHAPIAIVHLGLDSATLSDHAGFGFLAHPDSGLDILGATFDSFVFPYRAPEGAALTRVMIGGALRPELVDRDDTALVDLAVRSLSRALDRPVDPLWHDVVRRRVGIPQYDIGHLGLVATVERELARLGGIEVTGWGWRGIGVNGSIADAVHTTRRLHEDGKTAMLHPSAGTSPFPHE